MLSQPLTLACMRAWWPQIKPSWAGAAYARNVYVAVRRARAGDAQLPAEYDGKVGPPHAACRRRPCIQQDATGLACAAALASSCAQGQRRQERACMDMRPRCGCISTAARGDAAMLHALVMLQCSRSPRCASYSTTIYA